MTMTLVDVAPAELVADKNVRSKLGDLSGLVESIREHGVLQPLLVSEAKDGKFHVIAGFRRRAAAVKAKTATVPCVVTTNGEAQHVLERQMIENLQRADLSITDEAKGYEQLAAFGMSEEDIARTAGRTVDHVKSALTIAGSKTASTTAAKHDLTFDQAVAVAEFDGDKDAVAKLTTTATSEPHDFPHVLNRLRDARERAVKVEKLRLELQESNIPITTDNPRWEISLTDAPTRLSEIVSKVDPSKSMTAEEHATCPGHAAFIHDRSFDEPVIIWVCLAAKKNGHKSAGGESSYGSSDREVDAEERARVRAGNKEWRAAQPVRFEFIGSLVERRSVPKGVLRFVAEEIMGDPDSLGGKQGPTNETYVVALLGESRSKKTHRPDRTAGIGAVGREKTDARLPLILLAQIAADREQMMDDVAVWRHPTTAAVRWLNFLSAQGYGLSEIEKTVAKTK